MNPTIAEALSTCILIVDDDPDIREALSDMLEHEGYRVHTVGTGAAAVEQASQFRYGAVLLDIGLPDLDGHAVLKLVTDMDSALPVIILTGQATEQNTIGPLMKGAFAYATKPYNPSEIKALIRRAVGVRALSHRAETAQTALSESEERFRSVVQSTADAVILAEESGHVIFWNYAAERMFGYTSEEMMAKPLTLIMPERYRTSHQQALERLRASAEPRVVGKALELDGLRKDGSEFPLEVSLTTWKSHQEVFYGGIIRDITERKRREEALRQSEERFRQVAENIREVFWLSSVDKNEIIYVSPAYEQVWGRTCDSLYASPKSWLDAIHPDDRERVLSAALSKQASGDYCEEYRIVRPDGSIRWIRDRAFPIPDEAGCVYRVAGIAEDITDHRIADERKAARHAIARVLAEAGTLAEATSTILQTMCERLGWDVGTIWMIDEQADVLRCFEAWHAPDIDPVIFDEFNWQTVFARGIGLPGRVWDGGEPVWIRDVTRDANFPRAVTAGELGLHGALAFPIKLHAQVLGVLELFSRDVREPDDDLLRMLAGLGSQIGLVTERKRAQEALRSAYDKMGAILVSLPCAILIVDQSRRVVYANPLATQHFQPQQGTLTGSDLLEVLPLTASQWTNLLADLRATTGDGEALKEREFETQKRVYRYRLFPVTLNEDTVQQAGIVVWDITEQKQLQAQLIQSEKLSSLGTLVSGMAHEVNNPVQGILGMAEIILQEEDPDRVKEYAREIATYSQHVGMVVRNFSSYARPASRDKDTELDFRERISESVRLVQRTPQFGHVEVITDYQPVPKFRAFRTEIDQMFVNLISNAVDAMGSKGRLTLSTRMEGGDIVIRVGDTGCGIPKALLGKIFDPFVTTKEPGKGTGLGLSIVYRIVSKYGGRIMVESEVSKGTTFTIHFPVSS